MTTSTFRTAVVVPCYNEAERLDSARFLEFRSNHPAVEFYFVDDCSTDATLTVLRDLRAVEPRGMHILQQPINRGKAAAVQLGMQHALAEAPRYAGFWDADLATPLNEIPRFVEVLESDPHCEVLIGSRVKRRGRHVERRLFRHYLGRVFATAASRALELRLYDTQCGAKMFRFRPDLKGVFETAFCSRWAFDVELIARMLRVRRERSLPDDNGWIREQSLESWREVPGSKLRPFDLVVALTDVARVYSQTRHERTSAMRGRGSSA